MALVSKKLYESWYKEDTFVRRNFFYVFKNPLWDKGIPQGFSLCPMFWMSLLIGFLFLKCFLVPIVLISSYVTKKTIINIDTKYTNWLNKHFEGTKWDESIHIPQHGSLFLTVVVLFAFPTLALGAGWVLQELLYEKLYPASNPYLFWWLIILVAMVGCCAKYIHDHQGETDRCKVERYIAIWAIVGAITVVTIFHQDIWSYTVLLWDCLIEWIGEICSWIGSVISWIGSALLRFFVTGKPFGVQFPLFGWIVAFAAFSYFAVKFIPEEAFQGPPDPEFISEYQLWELIRLHHRAMNARYHNEGKRFIENWLDHNDIEEVSPDEKVQRMFTAELELRFLRKYFSLDTFFGQKHGTIEYSEYSYMRKRALDGNLNLVSGTDYKFGMLRYDLDYNDKSHKSYKIMTKIIKETTEDYDMIFKRSKIRHNRQIARNSLCRKCTGYAVMPLIGLWYIVKKTALFIAALAQYLWDVWKSKKQGFCPYVKFENINDEKSDN